MIEKIQSEVFRAGWLLVFAGWLGIAIHLIFSLVYGSMYYEIMDRGFAVMMIGGILLAIGLVIDVLNKEPDEEEEFVDFGAQIERGHKLLGETPRNLYKDDKFHRKGVRGWLKQKLHSFFYGDDMMVS